MTVSVLASPGSRATFSKWPKTASFFQVGMHLPQIFLVAGEVAASAGINQKRRAEIVGFPVGIARLDVHALGIRDGFVTDQPSRTSAPDSRACFSRT